MGLLKIVNWGGNQVFKGNSAPWMKLHRTLLTNRPYMKLSVSSKGVLCGLWILGMESGDSSVGIIELSYDDIGWRLGIDDIGLISSAIDECVDFGFIEIIEQDIYKSHSLRQFATVRDNLRQPATVCDSLRQPATVCDNSSPRGEERRGEERRLEKKDKKKITKKENYQNEDSESLWKKYPKVKSKGNKPKFEEALWQQLENGVSYEEINNSITRYADYCSATGIFTGQKTNWNMHAVTWINNREWETEYPAPAKPPEEDSFTSEYAHARAQLDRKQAAEAACDFGNSDDTTPQHYSSEGESGFLEGVFRIEEPNEGI